MPPRLLGVAVAAVGAAAVAFGVVAALNGRGAGVLMLIGGGLLLLWAFRRR